MRSQTGWSLTPTGAGVTGVSRSRPSPRRRHVARIAGTAVTALLASTLVPAVPAYAAEVPAFPNNITIFTDRDFVVVDFPDRNDEFAVITVTRAGAMIGQAEGRLDDVGSLEVNHPGGVCWGTGAGAPNITPNILAGDVVTVAFDGVDANSSVAQSPTVTGFSQVGKVVTVDGTLSAVGGPVADTANLEQRIVAPDLKTTLVGRRDVRAGDSKLNVFSSTLTFPTPTTFTATYTFDDLAVATTAAAGQARALTWQVADADANRQGITISEFGEVGGPGFGGCPLGTPVAATAPTTPVAVTATAGNSSAIVTWREQASGGAPLTRSLVKVFNAANVQVGALRPALAGDTSLTVTGLTNQRYRFQVAAQNAIGLSGFSLPSNAVTPVTVPNAPTAVSAVAGTRSALVRWTRPANNGSATLGFYVNAVHPTSGAFIGATRFAAANASSLNVTGLAGGTLVKFKVRARNAAGTSAISAASNAVTPKSTPGAPGIGSPSSGATGGTVNATARWTAPANTGGLPINGYVVTALRMNSTGGLVSLTNSPVKAATTRSLTMTLPAGSYRFVVRARNTLGLSAYSARSNRVTAR